MGNQTCILSIRYGDPLPILRFDLTCNPSNEFRVLLRQVGVNGSHHSLRHTFGTRLVKNGVPLPVVQALLGHADIESTMIYLQLDLSRKRDIQKKFIEYTQSKVNHDSKVDELIDWLNSVEILAWLDSL